MFLVSDPKFFEKMDNKIFFMFRFYNTFKFLLYRELKIMQV